MKDQKKVKKGWLAVGVGTGDDPAGGGGGFGKFMIPISHLYHPQFQKLLEAAREVYGYHSSGPLKLPCSVDEFLGVCRLIEREDQRCHIHQQQLLLSALSF